MGSWCFCSQATLLVAVVLGCVSSVLGQDDDDCVSDNGLPNVIVYIFLAGSGVILVLCTLFGFINAYHSTQQKLLTKVTQMEELSVDIGTAGTSQSPKPKNDNDSDSDVRWYKIVCSFDFLKKWLKEFWHKRSCFLPLTTHLADQATDIGVILSFWFLYLDQKNNKINCTKVDGLSLFVVSILAFIMYRIVSCMAIYFATKSLLKTFLQFFDLMIYRAIMINYQRDTSQPSSPQKWIQNYESMLESFPQLVIQLYYLMKTQSVSNEIVIVSLLLSLWSIVSKTVSEDKPAFEKYFQNFISSKKQLPQYARYSAVTINIVYILRVIFRILDILFRVLLISLIWIVIGGLFCIVYLVIEIGILIACSVWANDSTVLTWIGNTPLIILRKIYGTRKVCQKYECFGPIGIHIFYGAFYGYRWMSSCVILVFIGLFGLWIEIDCQNTILCSSTFEERNELMTKAVGWDCYLYCCVMLLIIPLFVICFYLLDIVKSNEPSSLSRDLMEMCLKEEWEGIMEMFEFGYFTNEKMINGKDERGITPLGHSMKQRNDLEVCCQLIKYGANLNDIDDFHNPAIVLIASVGNVKALKMAMDKGANANDDKDRHGRNALMMASNYAHLDLIKYLVNECNVNVNEKNNKGKTSLMICSCGQGSLDAAKLLIQYNANVNEKDNENKTALMYSCNEGNYKVAALLIENKADTSCRDSNGYSAIMYCAHSGHFDILKLLMSGLTEAMTQETMDEMLMAAAKGTLDTETIEYLIQEGANLTTIEDPESGQTLLMFAAAKGKLNIVKLLMQHKIDINQTDKQGKKAIDYAMDKAHHDVIQLLKQHHAINSTF